MKIGNRKRSGKSDRGCAAELAAALGHSGRGYGYLEADFGDVRPAIPKQCSSEGLADLSACRGRKREPVKLMMVRIFQKRSTLTQ